MATDTMTEVALSVRRLRNSSAELELVATRLERVAAAGLSEAAVQCLAELDRARRALLEALATQGTTPACHQLLEKFGAPARTHGQNLADDWPRSGGSRP